MPVCAWGDVVFDCAKHLRMCQCVRGVTLFFDCAKHLRLCQCVRGVTFFDCAKH